MTPTSSPITQQELNAKCWRICTDLRDMTDSDTYKAYFLVLLFLKYMSDVWQDLYAIYMAQYDEDGEAVERAMRTERFVIPPNASFDALCAAKDDENLGAVINAAIQNIEAANRPKLDGVFQTIDFHSEQLGDVSARTQFLKTILDKLADKEFDLRPSRLKHPMIGHAFSYLIDRFGREAGKKAGMFYTPSSVRTLVAKLAQAEAGHTIYDPVCGFGSLILEASLAVQEGRCHIFGQEKDSHILAMAKINMFLHSIDDAVLRGGDTLTSPKLLEDEQLMCFDRIVAHPPFSLNNWHAEDIITDIYGRFWHGMPPKSKGDWAFILHMLASAKPCSGRVVVIIPHGALFRGSSESSIRKSVIEANILDAVIGLPERLFSATSIPVALLIFDLRREMGGAWATRKDVLFVDAQQEFETGGQQNILTDTYIDRIVTTINTRNNSGNTHLADYDEIAAHGFDLSISRYVIRAEDDDVVDLSSVQNELSQLDKAMTENKADIHKQLKDLEAGL